MEVIRLYAAQTTINSPELTAAASGEVKVQTQTFRDGKVSGGFGSALPPLMFLLLFYVVILLLSSQMLNSTLEEKENRVTEMILTTLNPTTLITGQDLPVHGGPGADRRVPGPGRARLPVPPRLLGAA